MFRRRVSEALIGTALAQALPVVASLILARLFNPAAFGDYAAWLGIVTVLAVLLTLRLEASLAVLADGEERLRGMGSTVAVTLIASLVVFGMVWMYVHSTSLPGVFDDASLWLLAVPAASAVALNSCWQSWAAAEGWYRRLGVLRIGLAACVSLAQVSSGFVSSDAEALSLAHLAGAVLSLVIAQVVAPLRLRALADGAAGVRAFIASQRNLVVYSLPADVVNNASAQLPTLLVLGKFGPGAAGQLALAQRIVGAPISLLGRSVLDVFKRHASEAYRLRGECRSEYLEALRLLLALALVGSAGLALFSLFGFNLIFGEEWNGAGETVLLLLPLVAVRFVASPLTYMVYIAEKQRVDLVWQMALLVSTVATLSAFQSYRAAIAAYSVAYAILYFVSIRLTYRYSNGIV